MIFRRQLLPLIFILWSLGAKSENKFSFEGLEPEIKTQIKRQFPQLDSGEFSNSDLERLIEEMVIKNSFDLAQVTVRSDGSDRTYSLQLQRANRISSISISGVSSLSKSEVSRSLGLSENTSYDPQALAEARARVEDLYRAQGFGEVTCDVVIDRKPNKGVSLDFKVLEGPQTVFREFAVKSRNTTLNSQLYQIIYSEFYEKPVNETTMNLLRETLRSFLSRRGYYRTELIDPIVEPLTKRGFAKATYRLNNVTKYQVGFEGNIGLADAAIKTKLNLDDFTSSNPNVASELGTRVKSLYISEGFAKVEVQAIEEKTAEEFLRTIKLKIKEGPRIRIQEFQWLGTFSDPSKDYTQFLKDHSSPVFNNGYFVKEDLIASLNSLLTDRRNRGYLKARIVSTRTIDTPKKDAVIVQINFDEGPLTRLKSIQFIGNKQISELELLKLTDLQPNEPLQLYKLEEAINRLSKYYRDAGYLDMVIANSQKEIVSYSDDNALAEVRLEISEGPQVIVGSILVEGNTITKESLIKIELEFDVGQILTPDKIDESVARLQKTGLFDSVEIKTLEDRTPIAKRTVIVRVTDHLPIAFKTGAGANSERGVTVRGYLSLAHRNMFGTGRSLSGRVDLNDNISDLKFVERKVNVGYTEPYLFSSRLRGQAALAKTRSVTDFNRKIASDTDQFSFALEQTLTSNISFSFDLVNVSKIKDFFITTNTDLPSLEIGTIGPTLDIDFRDHIFFPTKGWLSKLSLEWGSPNIGSSRTINFYRSFASLTHYQALGTPKVIWANSLRTGFLKNISDYEDGSVPYDKKGLTLGGQSSIRGFTPDEAFPNQNDFVADYDPLKGRYSLKSEAQMMLFKTELRFPIFYRQGLYGAFFYDGGSVTVRDVDIKTPYRDSYGVGVRYATPLGAVNLEYAWKAKPIASRGESSSVFHFSIGTY